MERVCFLAIGKVVDLGSLSVWHIPGTIAGTLDQGGKVAMCWRSSVVGGEAWWRSSRSFGCRVD